MSQQQGADSVSIDDIPVDIANTQSGDVDPTDVPDEIEPIPVCLPASIRRRIRWSFSKRPAGGTFTANPALRWAIEWARHLTTDTPSDVERFDEFLEYLVTVGFADDV